LWTAFFLPFVPVLFRPRNLLVFGRALDFQPNFNFVLWFFVVLCLGVSLFQGINGIETPWINNYGDLAFHLGMINSFALGENFPPQYHIFAGERLSYPFFINLWSAAYWGPVAGYRMLSFIFTFQWLLLWCLVYWFLKGNRYWVAPWALLLGGGCYYGIWEKYSWELLREGYPWAVFLTTIWVTQRSMLFGVTVLLCVLHIVWPAFEDRAAEYPGSGLRKAMQGDDVQARLLLSGLLLGLSLLAHTHAWLVTVVFVVLMLSARAWRLGRKGLGDLLIFLAGLASALMFLPWLIGKGGALGFMFGWSEPYLKELGAWRSLAKSAGMWVVNIPAWLLMVGLYWALTARHLVVAVLILIFLLGNFVKLSYWDWDQIKFFISLYVLSIFLWSREERRSIFWGHLLMVVLTIPALVECYKLFAKGEMYTVYTKEAIAMAVAIRDHTPAEAIFAAKPDHNSPVTLTGRKLYLGYEGTLWSHGIEHGERSLRFKDLAKLCACKETVCPDYLLWMDAEKGFWEMIQPPACVSGTELPYLYRF